VRKLVKAIEVMLGLAVAVVLAVGVLFLVWPILDVAQNQVTVYPLVLVEGHGPSPANRSVYKVYPETQTVVHWVPGIDEVPDRLAKCAVRDRLNWRCEYSDGSAVLTMREGTFSDESRSANPSPLKFVYTSRLAWWQHMF
jgi:hypothetical protein